MMTTNSNAQSPTADDYDPGAGVAVNAVVQALAVQPDGKVLVGGIFATVGGVPHNGLARLDEHGSLDAGFTATAGGPTYPDVVSLAVQLDGKILVAGYFTTIAGQPRNAIARLNSDGTLDNGFDAELDGSVGGLAIQADGKILVGGGFTMVNGIPRNNVARLNSNGTLDVDFDAPTDAFVDSIAVQTNGQILIAGRFVTLAGQPRNFIGRLNSDGTLDGGFNPNANDDVYAIALQADGRILLGGYFSRVSNQPRFGLARLGLDGTLDNTFNPSQNGIVEALTVQADGKILIGGAFSIVSGQTRARIARVDQNGTLDPVFNPVASGLGDGVRSLALQADGRILVGGSFTALGGQSRTNLGRLYNNAPATQSFSRNGATVTWLRGGTCPEVWRTTIDYSNSISGWVSLGNGTRVAGGWQFTGISIPADSTMRVRGYVTGENPYFVEYQSPGNSGAAAPPQPSFLGVPVIPLSVVAGTPFTVTLTATNGGGAAGTDSSITASMLYANGSHNLTVSGPTGVSWAQTNYNYAPGEGTLFKTNCDPIGASTNHFVEAAVLGAGWPEQQAYSMSFTVTPLEAGTLYIYVRTTMRDPTGTDVCPFLSSPAASAPGVFFDQQSWPVERYAITVTPAPVTLTVENGLNNGFATVLKPVTLQANVLGGVQNVTNIEFYVGSQQIWSDDNSPYNATATWLPLYVDPPSYPLTAVARQSSGQSITSAPVNVVVKHPIKEMEPSLKYLPTTIEANGQTSMVSKENSIFNWLECDWSEAPSAVLKDMKIGTHTVAVGGTTAPDATRYRFTWESRAGLSELEAAALTTEVVDVDTIGSAQDRRFVFVAYSSANATGVYLPTDAASCVMDRDAQMDRFLEVPKWVLKRAGFDLGAGSQPTVRLFRKPDFSQAGIKQRLANNPTTFPFPQDLSLLETGTVVSNLIILVHGWNPGQAFGPGPEPLPILRDKFLNLGKSIQYTIGTIQGGTMLLGYDWGGDAATGGRIYGRDGGSDFAQAGSRAAVMAYQHGIALGDYLVSVSGTDRSVKKVQFICHSAGAWVAYAAAQKLLTRNGLAPEMQITLMDPYMPAQGAEKHSLLSTRLIDSLGNGAPPSKLRVIENYYASDSFTGSGTEQQFLSGRCRNSDVTWWWWEEPYSDIWHLIPTPYLFHGSPIDFYAHSVMQIVPGYSDQWDLQSGKGWPPSDMPMGWDNSLFMQEKISMALRSGGGLGNYGRYNVVIESGTKGFSLHQGSDAAMWGALSIAPGGVIMAFQFSFEDAGPGDQLVLNINGQQLWSFAGVHYLTNGLQGMLTTGPIDLDAFAGSTVNWEIRLHCVSGEEAAVRVDNIRVVAKPFNLLENNAPNIASSGETTTLTLGSRWQVEQGVLGPRPMLFQWWKAGSPIAGKTDSILTLPAVSLTSTGSYTLRATNFFGSVESQPFTLLVNTNINMPAITQYPTNMTVRAGQSAGFSVGATGTGQLSYQWYFKDVPISGAMGTSVSLGPVGQTNSGPYWVLVSNSTGVVSSEPGYLEVQGDQAPQIQLQPANAYVAAGGSLAFSVIADGSPTPAYQWRRNNSPLPGETNAAIILRHVTQTNSGTYDVIVSNSVGTVLSSNAQLVVDSPSININPVSWTAPALGGSTFVAVSASSNVAWLVQNTNAWLSTQPYDGIGSAQVSVTATTNATGLTRSGNLLIAGRSFSVTQPPPGNDVALDAGLLAYYPFNGNANDASGHAAHGRIIGPTNFIAGVYGQAIHLAGNGNFNSNGNHVAIPCPNFQSLNAFTVALWVREQGMSLSSGEAYLSFGDAYGGAVNISHFDASIYISASLDINNTAITTPFVSTSLNNWVHYCLVYSNGVQTAYRNAVPIGSLNAPVSVYTNNAGIGIHWWSYGNGVSTRFVGDIDDVRVYNRAVSTSERQLLATGAGSSSPKPLPQLSGKATYSGAGFAFPIGGPSGLIVLIEASTNLVTWTRIQTNVMVNGQVQFTDPDAHLFPKRFYRAAFFTSSSSNLLMQAGGTYAANLPPGFGFGVRGVPGQTITVEASTNLAAWLPVQTNLLYTGYYYFSDPQSFQFPRRFYRLKSN